MTNTMLSETEGPSLIDADAYLRMLDAAEERHHLDETGYLDELAKAAKACEHEEKTHTQAATDYFLARCFYFAAAYRRTVRPNGSRSYGGESVGFVAWCRRNGFHHRNARAYAKIGLSPNPSLSLKEYRRAGAKRAAYSRRNAAVSKQVRENPLQTAIDAWRRLTLAQRVEFLDAILKDTTSPTAVLAINTVADALTAEARA